MFFTVKKIWLDTTTYRKKYVAKDVKGLTAFLGGFVLLFISAIAGCFDKTVPIEAGAILLSYSLGNQAFKSYYQYKNNSVDTECDDKKPDK